MQSLKAELSLILGAAFEKAGVEQNFGQVRDSDRPDLCQFQCNGALAAAKEARINPRQFAQKVLDEIKEKEIFKETSLAGPGFINITLTDSYLIQFIEKIKADSKLGCYEVDDKATVLIDFGGPNVAKPMHVGHLRSGIIGDCLQRLHRFLGSKVISVIHLGDWGTQMGMLIEEVKREKTRSGFFRQF